MIAQGRQPMRLPEFSMSIWPVAEELVHRAPDHQAVPQDCGASPCCSSSAAGMIHHIFPNILMYTYACIYIYIYMYNYMYM